jgi:hypothetical protein
LGVNFSERSLVDIICFLTVSRTTYAQAELKVQVSSTNTAEINANDWEQTLCNLAVPHAALPRCPQSIQFPKWTLCDLLLEFVDD